MSIENKFIAQYSKGQRESSIVSTCLNEVLDRLIFLNVSSYEVFRIRERGEMMTANAKNLVFWNNVGYWRTRSEREPELLEKELPLIQLQQGMFP